MQYSKMRACLHGGGGPQVGEVTRLGGIKNQEGKQAQAVSMKKNPDNSN